MTRRVVWVIVKLVEELKLEDEMLEILLKRLSDREKKAS
jgi:hypothetical protein